MSTPTLPPASPTRTLDFGRCFTFLTEDPDWVKKLLIGGAFTLASALIIGAFFVAGYVARFVRRVAAGEARPLPEWDDLGGIFGDGLKLVGLYVACMIGAVLLVLLLACPMGLIFAALSGASQNRAAEEFFAVFGSLGFVALYGLIFVLGFAVNLVLPAAAVRVIFKDNLAAGFDVRGVIQFVRDNLGNYLLSLVVFILANFLAQFGVLLCCVGVFPAIFWAYLTLGYALGDTVRLNPASLG
jgi:hypothetical protein